MQGRGDDLVAVSARKLVRDEYVAELALRIQLVPAELAALLAVTQSFVVDFWEDLVDTAGGCDDTRLVGRVGLVGLEEDGEKEFREVEVTEDVLAPKSEIRTKRLLQ